MAVFCTDLQNFAECTTDSVKMRFYRKVGKTPQNSAFFRSLKGEIMSIRVLFVCHGNICRSPMAEFVMKDLVNKKGIASKFYIASAATSTEELGNPVHYGTRNKLAQVGISTKGKYAVQMKRSDYQEYDYIIGMDNWNYRNMLRIVGKDKEQKISLLLDYTDHPRDVADPWYTGDFETTYQDVLAGCQGFLAYLQQQGKLEL